MAASCSDDNPGSPGASLGGPGNGGSVTEINGTKIDSRTTLCGLISDAKSGTGISGVMVGDGFNCVQTDANGVYQLVRDSRATDRLLFDSCRVRGVPFPAKRPALFLPAYQ